MEGIRKIPTVWGNGIQFYLRREVPIVRGHVICVESSREYNRPMKWGALAAVVCLFLPVAAEARKPIISYVEGGQLKLFDAELNVDITPPSVAIPGMVPRYSMSLDGRYVVWVDDASPKQIHVLDRDSGNEVPLAGINVYANPGGLTISNSARIGFDDNGNGPALVYDSASQAFIDTGLGAANKHRQPRLSGDGLFLATTCADAANCEVDLGPDANAYVQNLSTGTDTGFPDNLTGATDEDEEHPCINGDGSLVGVDITNPMKRDIFLFDRSSGTVVPLPGLNDVGKDDTNCVIDSSGGYIGFIFDNTTFRVFERASGNYLILPANKFIGTMTFSDPFPPPAAPDVTDFRVTENRFRVRAGGGKGRKAAGGGAALGTRFRYALSEEATVKIAIRQRRVKKNCRRKCVRYRGVGSLGAPGAAGGNSRRFSGRLRGKALKPNRYLAELVATDAEGNASAANKARFRIIP